MTFSKFLRINLAVLILTAATGLSAAENRSVRVIDAGPDGDERYYSVYCPDGTRAAVVKREDKTTVCTTPRDESKDVCKNWSVDEAARAACGV